jgi:hypothetical protein
MLPLSLLLNWRVWAALVLVAAVALAGLTGFRAGERRVQEQFDSYKVAQLQEAEKQQEAARLKEQALNESNRKLGDDLAKATQDTNNGIRDLAALRMRQHSTSSSIVSQNPSPSSSPASTPEDGVLAECRDRRDQLAGEAQQLSDQVNALQEYIKGVLSGP